MTETPLEGSRRLRSSVAALEADSGKYRLSLLRWAATAWRCPAGSQSFAAPATLSRHVRPGSQAPRGKTTSIAFRTVQRVGVHTDEPTVLFLDCATRQYFFRFPSATLCETCAGRIAVAAAQAGDAQRSDRGT